MRVGYSLLLREFVDAELVEFGDCESYQITCPACYEPLFKKTRGRVDGASTHFLSHYSSGEGDEKDCELRVSGIRAEVLTRGNAAARKQALTSFLAVMRQAIVNSQAPLHPPGVFAAALARLLSRKVFDQFEPYAREASAVVLRLPDPARDVAATIASFPRYASLTPFWRRCQAGYVLDVLRHLSSGNAKANMRVLAAAAFVHVGLNAGNYRRERSRLQEPGYDPMPAVDLIEALVTGKSPTALRRMAQRQLSSRGSAAGGYAAERAIRNAIVGELVGPMVGILSGIPFPDLVRDRNASLPIPDHLSDLRKIMEVALNAMRL
jgi:hypothetical protein